MFFGAAKDHAGTSRTRLSVTRGAFGAKLGPVGLLQIGPKPGPWVRKAKQVELATVPQVQRQTIRVARPRAFRRPYIEIAGTPASDFIWRKLDHSGRSQSRTSVDFLFAFKTRSGKAPDQFKWCCRAFHFPVTNNLLKLSLHFGSIETRERTLRVISEESSL